MQRVPTSEPRAGMLNDRVIEVPLVVLANSNHPLQCGVGGRLAHRRSTYHWATSHGPGRVSLVTVTSIAPRAMPVHKQNPVGRDRCSPDSSQPDAVLIERRSAVAAAMGQR